jgi:acetyl esterase/lipase
VSAALLGFRLVTAALQPLALARARQAQHSGRPEAPPAPRLRLPWRCLRHQVYTPAGWPQPLHADVYLPQAQGPMAGVLLVHGGAWQGGDPAHTTLIAEKLARRGFVVVNATYRLAPAARFPAPVRDLQQALRWMREHAAELNLDPARIGAWGYSAGAHLVSLLGLLAPGDALHDPEVRLRAIVAGGVPADLRKFRGGTLVPAFLGEKWSADSKVYRESSPVCHVRPDSPPVFLYHGGADRLVRPDQATDFKAALDAAGVRSELYLMPGLGHVMANLLDGPAVQRGADFLQRELAPLRA